MKAMLDLWELPYNGQMLQTAKSAPWTVQNEAQKALVLVQKLTPDALRIACPMRTFPYF
jgi:hypothetical protein